jgi:hypothetical protein
MSEFHVGDRVIKRGEDSQFEGEVVALFTKRNGKTLRYVIENDDGVLHIAGPKQLHWIAKGFIVTSTLAKKLGVEPDEGVATGSPHAPAPTHKPLGCR